MFLRIQWFEKWFSILYFLIFLIDWNLHRYVVFQAYHVVLRNANTYILILFVENQDSDLKMMFINVWCKKIDTLALLGRILWANNLLLWRKVFFLHQTILVLRDMNNFNEKLRSAGIILYNINVVLRPISALNL